MAQKQATRQALRSARPLQAALAPCDAVAIETLSMRRIAQHPGVARMMRHALTRGRDADSRFEVGVCTILDAVARPGGAAP